MPISALNSRLLTLCGAVLMIIAVAGCDSGNSNSPNQNSVGAVLTGDASGFSATISDADSPHFVRGADLKIDAYHSGTFAFSPDGHKIVAPANHYISVWDLATLVAEHLYLMNNAFSYKEAAFSSDNHTIAFGTNNGQLGLWDTDRQNDAPSVLPLTYTSTRSVEFSPDAHWLVASSTAPSASGGYVAKLWDLTKGQPTINNGFGLDANPTKIWAVAFAPDSSLLATGGIFGDIEVWDLQHLDKDPAKLSVNSLNVPALDSDGAISLAISPDMILAVGTPHGHIWLWDLRQAGSKPVGYNSFSNVPEDVKKGAPPTEFLVTSVAFSPDGKMLFAGYGDGSVRVWMLSRGIVQGELATARVLDLQKNVENAIESLRVSPDGRMLGIMGLVGIRLWDIEQPTHTGKATP